MKNFISKLGDAVAWVTFKMFAGLVWLLWYAIAYYSSPLLLKWFLYLLPPIEVVIALVISTKRGRKDESN